MKTDEIRELSDSQLRQKLEDNHKELFNLRFQVQMRKLKNHQRLPIVKRENARIHTILRERELMRLYGGAPMEEDEEAQPVAPAKTTSRRGGLFRRGRQKDSGES